MLTKLVFPRPARPRRSYFIAVIGVYGAHGLHSLMDRPATLAVIIGRRGHFLSTVHASLPGLGCPLRSGLAGAIYALPPEFTFRISFVRFTPWTLAIRFIGLVLVEPLHVLTSGTTAPIGIAAGRTTMLAWLSLIVFSTTSKGFFTEKSPFGKVVFLVFD